VGHEITLLLVGALLPLLCVACASGDIDLGRSGAIIIPPVAGSKQMTAGTGGMLAAAGAGGVANVAGQAQGGMSAGRSGQAGSSAGSSGIMMTAGVSATAGAGGSASASQPSTGCGKAPPSSDTTIAVSAMTATYIVDVPAAYSKDRAYPLMMSFRGAGVTADQFRSYLNLTTAVGSDAIVVNVNTLGSTTAAWDVNRDTPLFDALLTQLESTYCIDQHRVFAVGHSAGGFFTNSLACTRGSKLRAIAVLSAAAPVGTCQGEFAVWMSQGNMDMTVPVATGRADRDFWASRNTCDASMFTAVDPAPCVEYAGCDAGFAVRYCEYDGDLNVPSFAAAGIWAFFKGL
jgi:polyhydroxybutyrate depolymerase